MFSMYSEILHDPEVHFVVPWQLFQQNDSWALLYGGLYLVTKVQGVNNFPPLEFASQDVLY
jgi:hypothetical protein